MSYTNGLDKPSDYFNTKLYTGTNATQSITGVGFQPDFSWFKTRSDANGHTLIDSVRGITKRLASHNTQGDITQADMLTSFDTDGLTLGADSNNYTNWSGKTWVVWNWLASNTTASNTDGTITSTVSANQTSGFSIVSYTGNGTAGATIGHGLGSAPKMIIIKDRDTGTHSWVVGHDSLAWTSYLLLNNTDAKGTATTIWNDTAPTSSVFTLGTNVGMNGSGSSQIAYCFAEKKGYSKFGSYVGNGSSSGPYIHLGYKPSLVIRKITSGSSSWIMQDNKRSESGGFNQIRNYLFADSSQAEVSNQDYFNIDFLSNGFKIRSTDGGANGSGQTYIYMAFAENPFVTSTGIPTTAR
jgi:hypothetical protein